MTPSTALPAGTYAIFEEIGSGGMATVHLGRRLGPVSFSRMVAIKRLHAHLARDPEFVTMFLDEARVAARVRHPNVVPTLDVVTGQGQPFLVMEYVQGETLARLLASVRRQGGRISVPIASSILVGVLHGLHAAHEATNEQGTSLGIVHRDVSPQNVIVGLDGIARVLDFGVAKAVGRLQTTREGQIKGKLGYTAPELVRGGYAVRAADIYSAGVVFWEILTGERLFAGDNDANVLERVLFAEVPPPSARASGVSPAVDAIVLRALARDPASRFATASEMARAIETSVPIARPSEVGDWVQALAGEALAERAHMMARIERGQGGSDGGTADVVAIREHRESGDVFRSVAAVAGTHDLAKTRRSWLSALALVLSALAVSMAVVLLVEPRRHTQQERPDLRPTPSATKTVASAPAVLAASPTASTAPSQPPTISADELPTATSTARHPVPPPPAMAAPVSRPHAVGVAVSPKPTHEPPGAPPPGAQQPAATAKPACDPPWRIDAAGIKQYKLECL